MLHIEENIKSSARAQVRFENKTGLLSTHARVIIIPSDPSYQNPPSMGRKPTEQGEFNVSQSPDLRLRSCVNRDR